ncbi:MAG: cytochrome b, partial [Gammaproteobacteria bacterium]
SPVKSIRYKGWMSKTALVLFVISFIVLSYLGLKPASDLYVILARIFTAIYFLYFILMPWYTSVEKTKPAPERVTYHA